MKTLLLLLAAVSWAAATVEPVKVFLPNREYRYDYVSQILTGIPTLNSQYSGLKIKARAVVHVESDRYVTVKLTSIEVFRVKEEAGVVPTQWASPAILEPIPVEQSTELIESLVIPIKFRYQNGMVTKVYAVSMDPYWSVNIKRGIISLMNLDLNIQKPAPISSEAMRPFMDIISSDYNTMSEKTAYKVIEPSVLGDCETWYSVMPIPAMSKVMVSKVVDTKKCSPKIMAEAGMFAGMITRRNISEMNELIQNTVSVDYELSGTRHEFMIKSALLTGKYVFAPVVDNVNTMDGYVLQKLIYVKDEAIGRRIVFESAPVPLKSGLHAYIPAQNLVMRETLNNMRAPGSRIEMAKIEMVDKLLDAIVENCVNKVEPVVPDMIQTVVSIMRTLSKEEIMEIITKYSTADVSGAESIIEKKRSLILDILTTLPHPEVPLILMRLVKERHITGVYASALINIATLTTTPSPVVINELVEMVKEPEIVRQPEIRRSIILGIGILSNKLVNLHEKMGIPKRTTSVLIKNVVREIKALLESSDIATKVAVVKAIGNSGIVDFFPDVERIVKDKSQPIVIREQAIYALRRMAPVARKPVRSVLLPVFMDTKERPEVRVAAFVITMETRPELGTIQMIAHRLNAEPSVQVASFVYSYLQNLARSYAPDLRPLRIMAKRVLMTVRPVIVSPVFNSKSIDAGIFTKYAGVCVELDKLNDVNRALPLAVVNRIYGFIFGRRINIAEIGVKMEGVDEVLRKVAGIGGVLVDIWYGRKDISSILDPLSELDLGKVEREIRKIMAQTDIPVREADVLKLAAYIKVFGHELNFISADKEMIRDAIRTVQSASYSRMLDVLVAGYNVDVLRAVPVMDNALIMPTPVGLPITLNISAIAAVAIKGQVKLDGITAIRDLISSPRKVSVAVNIRPSADIKIYQTLGIRHDIIQCGATVRRRIAVDLPMSFKVDVDRNSEKISLRIDVPKMIAPSIVIENSPELFYQFVPMRISSYSASMYEIHLPRCTPIGCQRSLSPIEVMGSYEVPVLFMKAKVSGVINYPYPAFGDPVILSMSPQQIAATLEPAYSTPEAVVIEVAYGKSEVVVRRETQGGWLSWFGSEAVDEAMAAADRGVGDEFVPVSASSLIANPIRSQLLINVYTVSGYHDAMIKSKLTVITDPSRMIYQINYQAIGSQVIMAAWKVKMETLIHVPRIITAALGNQELTPNGVVLSTDIAFGVDSFTENTVVVKIMPAVLRVEPEIAAPVNCCRNISLKAVVYYSRVASNVRADINSVIGMIKPWIIPYVSQIMQTKAAPELGNVEVIFQVFPQIRKVKVIAITPETTLYFDDIVIPSIWPLVQPVVPPTVRPGAVPLLPEITTLRRAPKDIASAFYASCIVTPTNITTLAQNTMPLPEIAPTCEIILAQDASPQNLYAVLSTPVTAAGARSVKVLVPYAKIEIPSSLMREEAAVIVNGVARTTSDREPIVITRSIDGKVREVAEIVVIGQKMVVRATEVGVVVEVEGVRVTVAVSPLVLSAVKGMCAYVPTVPIMNPRLIAIGASPFSAVVPPIRSFVVTSEQCPANGVVPSIPSSACQMVDRTIRITRVSEGIEQVCFSVRPMPACSGFCTPANSISETVGFHCIPASEIADMPYAMEAAEGIRTEIVNKMVHTYQAVLVPTRCIA